jgi:serine/threonine-protein kinase
MALEIGATLDGKYRIVRVIGVGGMGTVYEGEHTLIRRRVAIKVLGEDPSKTPDNVRRFEREAQAAGQIGSDHILEVLDVGTTDGHRFMVMEYLEGETLAERMDRCGRMTPAQIAPIARQVLTGLAAAHGAKIVHRDLKPSNVFIVREKAGIPDFVKIIDFGISKFEAPEVAKALTQTGAVLGTPYYMSPEQARGESADARSDLHAFGVILYEAITGRMPFEGKNFNELMFAIGAGPRPSASKLVPDLDPRFEAIIAKAMQLRPEHRYQTAQEVAKDLEAWMRANALSTTTGEILLSDLAPLLAAAPPSSRRVDEGAVTVAAAQPDTLDRRRTVTNASVDTLSPTMARSRRLRWVALAAAGCAIAAGAVVLVPRATRHTTAEPLPAVSAAAAASVVLEPPAASSAPVPSARAVASSTDAPDASSNHARKPTKPARPVARPAKTVDFGY